MFPKIIVKFFPVSNASPEKHCCLNSALKHGPRIISKLDHVCVVDSSQTIFCFWSVPTNWLFVVDAFRPIDFPSSMCSDQSNPNKRPSRIQNLDQGLVQGLLIGQPKPLLKCSDRYIISSRSVPTNRPFVVEVFRPIDYSLSKRSDQ